MKCPYCGTEMISGSIDQADHVVWVPDDQPPLSIRDLLTWEGIKTLCTPLKNIAFRTKKGWSTDAASVPAHHCPACNLFLFRGRVVDEE